MAATPQTAPDDDGLARSLSPMDATIYPDTQATTTCVAYAWLGGRCVLRPRCARAPGVADTYDGVDAGGIPADPDGVFIVGTVPAVFWFLWDICGVGVGPATASRIASTEVILDQSDRAAVVIGCETSGKDEHRTVDKKQSRMDGWIDGKVQRKGRKGQLCRWSCRQW